MEIFETELGGTSISIETGRMAKQANGSVVVRYGETTVLVAVTAAKEANPGQDFFPLSVFYVEKTYSAGRIPGGFFKREGRLSDRETLISRFIDRPLRPLFDKNFKVETVVQATVLSYDYNHESDVAAMLGASAALLVSDVPFTQPVAGVRVGQIDGAFVINPSEELCENSALNIFMAGTKDAILMVEGEAREVDEKTMLDAIMFGHEQIQPLLELQQQLMDKCGKAKRPVPEKQEIAGLKEKVAELVQDQIKEALSIKSKVDRNDKLDEIKDSLMAKLTENPFEEEGWEMAALDALDSLKKAAMRQRIVESGQRIDGRSTTDIREITCETGILPRVHGSALFTRGETQALVVSTLGTKEDEQMIDSLSGMSYKNFYLHYNFPSFSVGEARPPRGPGRREIGHGFLAEKGLLATVPTKEEFPYTIRLVSEILESNGSSSMATVCGGSLAMMDAGVPLKAATAGIAMGLIKEGDKTVVLSDILGDEDALGDMDFKVVGTEAGITALQMDIKITGLERATVEAALAQAKDGRLHILGKMNETINEPRKGLSSFAPRFVTHRIAPDKIRELIGPGGKVIKGIVEKTKVKIDIEDDGIVHISSIDHAAVDKALEMINEITRQPEIGQVYTGPVTKTADYGVFVQLYPGTEGLVHISNIMEGRVRHPSDVVKIGEQVKVKVVGFDRRGKLQLSMRHVTQED